MDYVITTNDGETESVFLAYKEEQRRLRAHVSTKGTGAQIMKVAL